MFDRARQCYNYLQSTNWLIDEKIILLIHTSISFTYDIVKPKTGLTIHVSEIICLQSIYIGLVHGTLASQFCLARWNFKLHVPYPIVCSYNQSIFFSFWIVCDIAKVGIQHQSINIILNWASNKFDRKLVPEVQSTLVYLYMAGLSIWGDTRFFYPFKMVFGTPLFHKYCIRYSWKMFKFKKKYCLNISIGTLENWQNIKIM
jgi:hypothetical protein